MLYFDKITSRNIEMSKILLLLLTNIALVITLQAAEVITDQTKLQELKTKNKVLQDPVLQIKAAMETADRYALKLVASSPRGSQLLMAFLDKKTSELHIGSGYDKDGKAILFPKDTASIKEGVAFSYGSGSKEIYIVTDPECPYCTRLEKSIHGKLSDYTVHVIFFPLSFHKKAPAMVDWIMQGKDDGAKKERFEQVMLKGSTDYSALIKDPKKPYVYSEAVQPVMKKMQAAVLELNVRGTPAIYDMNFNTLPQDQLFKGLK